MSLLRLNKLSTSDPYWENLLHKILERIVDLEPRARVYIFGSFVEGRFTAESDLDLAVIVPDTWSTKIFLQKIYEAGRLSTWPLDLLVFKEVYFNEKSLIGGVCFDVKESGVELYPNWRLSEPSLEKI